MGNQKRGSPCQPCCNVATLNLTVNSCTIPTVGFNVTLTQGATSITETTDSSGVAHFSLPATGTWAYSFPSPPTGYLSVGGNLLGIATGVNTRTVNIFVDGSGSGYFCDQGGACGQPVLSLTVTWTGLSFASFPAHQVFTSVLTRDATSGVVFSPWVAATDSSGATIHWARIVIGGGTGFEIEGSGATPMPPATWPATGTSFTPIPVISVVCPAYQINLDQDHTPNPQIFLGGTVVH